LTAKAFDEEGYYRLGDALKFADPDDPGKGLLFDGRIAEDFKSRPARGSMSGRCGPSSPIIAHPMCVTSLSPAPT